MRNETGIGKTAAPAACLIVEDSEFDGQKMARVVKRTEFSMRVTVTPTLDDARKALETTRPSLILLDNNLPDGLGANFALELAQDEELARVPVIMVSDWPSPFMWEKAASAGVLFVLSKSEFEGKYVHAALKKGWQKRRKMN